MAADRPGNRRTAHATLAAVGDLADRATLVLSAPAVLRESAARQLEVLTSAEVGARLRATPVAALRDRVGRGVRLGSVAQAGVRSVADVLDAPDHRLLAIAGVGPQTVQEVRQAARQTAIDLQGRVQFRIDPDRRDAAQTALLATIAATRAADAAGQALGGALQAYLEQTGPLVAAADRVTRRLGMIFAGRATKDAALAALGRLEDVLADPRVGGLRQAVDAQRQALDPSAYDPDRLWADYLRDAATVNTVLAEVGGVAPDDDAARGYVPDELHQQISATPLDTSRLTVTLRNYQAFGAKYAIHQQRSMLGDEMGLGKTVQALAALAHLAANGQRRFLVVCPASVQVNWVKETARHSTLDTHVLHGPHRDDAGRRWLRRGGVAVTTFTTLPRLPADVRDADVAMLVVDEAHFAKNPDAARSQAVAVAARRAQRTLFLTGTPMENRVEEFRTLVGYLQPHVALRVSAADALAGAPAFRRGVSQVYLRRNQLDVLAELPEKIETEAWVQLGDDEEQAYRAAVERRNLQAMRQATFTAGSAKLERLVEIVEEAAEDGMKVLIFSYFLGALDVCAHRFPTVGAITGSVPPARRQDLVGEFAARPGHAVLRSQVEAGGVGMNMQAASVVVLVEPQWKPSTEEQAIARAHRMGQVRAVQVHRLLAKDSVDERIREVQEGKRLLFDHFARRSEAKDADSAAVDTAWHRPEVLDDGAVPLERRVVLAEQHRLGLP